MRDLGKQGKITSKVITELLGMAPEYLVIMNAFTEYHNFCLPIFIDGKR